jgi:predicted acetylornithine/succinylornithine family transaminase
VNLAELQALEARWVMPTYARLEVEVVRGEGARLWDVDGKEYLDFLSGVGVCSVGHCHPAVVDAIREQAGELLHVSNLLYTEPAIRLAERLASSSLGGKVFLCNSGAEANECAIKLARRHAVARGVDEPEIVVLERAFHGRTMGTLSATPKLARKDLFGPMLPGFRAVPGDDADAIADAVSDRTAAVLLEPVQGENGVYPIPGDVLTAARRACDAAGALLVFDEIQAGLGRTGSLWAYEQTPVQPDVLTSAKALAGGLPAAACVTSPEHGEVLGHGEHGSTFAGGPLVASAALAALDVIDDPELLRRVRELGSHLREGIAHLDGVRVVRGRGLMVGCELERKRAPRVVEAALEAGLVINSTGPSALRFLPPLVIDEPDVDEALSILGRVLPSVLAS